ncbi:ABC transporter substrate-binding protein [Metabacillus dongyingensis]|uniref:ABC transporter substrate-binding protein n=1 Tax=Metabacillus dongyingensis TaxID=2874282 RepID=UPI003B8C542D
MKALYREFVLMLLAVSLVFVLGACSSKTSKEGEKVEISFWHGYTERDSEALNERAEAFNKSQDKIHVKIVGNQNPEKQLTAISGGNPPDIVQTQWNNIGPWADAGAVQDLDENIKKDQFDTSRIIPAALERMVVKEKTYALPITMSMSSNLLYNKEAFEKAGLTSPPETMEELMEYAKKLTLRDKDNNITQIGFVPDYPWIDNVFWPIVFGGSFYDDATGEVTPNGDENITAIEFQHQFYEEFGEAEIDKFRSGMGKMDTKQDPLLTGKLAMMIGWEYNFEDERGPEGPIGIAPFPYPADKPELKGSGMVSPVAMFIPKNAKHKNEAWEFLKFLLSDDSQVKIATTDHKIPIIKDVLDDPLLTENKDMEPMLPFYEAAKNDNLKGFPNSIYINEYLQALTEETEKTLKGTVSAKEAMDNVKEKIQPLADKAK